MIRLIASDLDGTLLRNDHTVSARTRAVLARARQAGLQVVLVTGRPLHATREVARLAGVGGLAICSNGALLYDLDRDEVRRHEALHHGGASELIRALRQALPGVTFAAVRPRSFHAEAAYLAQVGTEHDPLLSPLSVHDALDFCTEPITKLIARHANLTPEELLERLLALGLSGFSATHSGAPFVEIHAQDVTKAWALTSLCEDLGLSARDVIAFGDAPNDLPMLAWAGRGVAMANAHPAVLAVAREVTLSNEQDGVAVMLEALLEAVPPASLATDSTATDLTATDLTGG